MEFQIRPIYFGKNLQYLRKKRGYEQKDIAEMIGVGRSSISNYENDRSKPEFNVFLMLVEIFGISSDALLYIDLSPKSNLNHNNISFDSFQPVYYVTKEEFDHFKKETRENFSRLEKL